MKILFVSATLAEILPLCQFLDIEATKIKDYHYSLFQNDIYILITGPGIMSMTFSLSTFCTIHKIDLAVNAGIAGSFDTSCILGSVYNVKKDRIADLGAEFPDGSFQDIFEMNLLDINPNLHLSFVEQCFISPILKEYTYLRSIIEILFKAGIL